MFVRIQVVTWLFLISYLINLLPITLYSGAIAMEQLFGIEQIFGISHVAAVWIMVWIIGIIGSIYALSGGLRAVAVSDTLNGVALVIGGLLIPFFAIKYLGDGNLGLGFSKLATSHPEKWNAIGTNSDPVPFSTLFTGLLLVNLYYWGTDQSIIQRGLGAKNLEEGQKGVVYAGFLKVLTPFIVIVPGIIAFYIYGGGLDAQKADMIYPRLVSDVLPQPLLGFFAAAMMGAILSTFNSVLNSASTLYALDIYKPSKRGKGKTDSDFVKKGRIFGIIVAIASMFIAPFIMNAPNGLFEYLQKINGFFNVPIFTIMLMGYMTKRVPPKAAKIGLTYFVATYGFSQLFGSLSHNAHLIGAVIMGLILISAIIVALKKQKISTKEALLFIAYFVFNLVFLSIVWKTNLHFFHVSAVLFIATSVMMKTIGTWSPTKESFHLESSNVVSLAPWKGRVKTSAFVLFCMIAMYFIFSPLGIAQEGGINSITIIALILLAVVITILAKLVDKKVQIKDAQYFANQNN